MSGVLVVVAACGWVLFLVERHFCAYYRQTLFKQFEHHRDSLDGWEQCIEWLSEAQDNYRALAREYEAMRRRS